ncbi:MAG: PilZ domain-containing protein [Phycisphaerales bacterium]|nr:PilZ domain-containing protein [Phycisphaerales bacterium]
MRATQTIDSSAAAKAIDTAITSRVQVVLESAAFPNTTINGVLISGDDTALLMEVTGHPEVDFESLAGVQCQAFLYGDRRYTFSTNVTTVPQWGKTRSIAIQRPKTMGILERRRFLRAKLAPSSKVTLQWERACQTHRHKVNLLNISADGIACRLEDAVSALIEKKAELSVSFELPEHEQPFELSARVTNKTPASEGHTILGLQFVAAEKDAQVISALRIAVEGGKADPVESEVCV